MLLGEWSVATVGVNGQLLVEGRGGWLRLVNGWLKAMVNDDQWLVATAIVTVVVVEWLVNMVNGWEPSEWRLIVWLVNDGKLVDNLWSCFHESLVDNLWLIIFVNKATTWLIIFGNDWSCSMLITVTMLPCCSLGTLSFSAKTRWRVLMDQLP